MTEHTKEHLQDILDTRKRGSAESNRGGGGARFGGGDVGGRCRCAVIFRGAV